MNSGTKKYRNVDEKKNSKKKERAKAREMPSRRKERPGFWKVRGKELRKSWQYQLWQTTYPVFIPVHTGVLA